EKYGERVRAVRVGDFSLELCGGTHLKSTAETGLFKLTVEGSIGSGLRRVEAVTGEGSIRYVEAKEEQLNIVAGLLKAAPHEIVRRVESLISTNKSLEDENEALLAKLARFQVQDLMNRVKKVKDVIVLSGQAAVPDMDSLRGMVDILRDNLASGVIVLGSGSPAGNKVNLVAAVS
ncbi:MAG: DHHA1 domain-containing protein, partial [Firmicutes bacterium]|nr:DHHA1 domain-containing protein [Bacillota bacterium]